MTAAVKLVLDQILLNVYLVLITVYFLMAPAKVTAPHHSYIINPLFANKIATISFIQTLIIPANLATNFASNVLVIKFQIAPVVMPLTF